MCNLELDEKKKFGKNKARYDGYDSYCKLCRKNKYKQLKQDEYSANKNKYNNLIWKQIPNFNKYEASSCGKIRNIKTKRLIKGSLDSDGYLVSSLSNCEGKFTNIKFHRIIAQTFIENPDNKPTINHKDKNKQNNDISNLEWNSHDEQSIHKNITNPLPPVTKTTKKIIMFNDNIETLFNSLKDCCKYISENNLCDKDERYIHNQIFISIQNNKKIFNYFWKYSNDNINNEIWEDWNDIKISNYGRIKDKYGYIKTPKIPKNKNKYITFLFNKKTYRLHRLVAELFIDNPDNKLIVNHIDGNKHNNKSDNLEWVTSSENQLHAYKYGLQPVKSKIKQIDINTNNIIKIWDNMNEIKNELKLSKSGISCCLSGKYKTSQGYKWMYL
jgi:hypothetical protein